MSGLIASLSSLPRLVREYSTLGGISLKALWNKEITPESLVRKIKLAEESSREAEENERNKWQNVDSRIQREV